MEEEPPKENGVDDGAPVAEFCPPPNKDDPVLESELLVTNENPPKVGRDSASFPFPFC